MNKEEIRKILESKVGQSFIVEHSRGEKVILASEDEWKLKSAWGWLCYDLDDLVEEIFAWNEDSEVYRIY